VRENLTLAALADLRNGASPETTGRARRPFHAASWHQGGQRRAEDPLSGGNQQKVLRDGCARIRNSSPRRADLAVSTLRKGEIIAELAEQGARGSDDSSEVEELVEGSQRRRPCVTGGQSRNSVASRRT